MISKVAKIRTRFFLDNNIRALLVSLVLLLALYPFFDDVRFSSALLNLLISIVLLSSLSALSADRRRMLIGVVLAIPALGTTWGDVFYPSRWMHIGSLMFMTLFYAYITFIVLSYVLRAKSISTDEIFGAICVYLLMGLLWGSAYALLETLSPGSFFIDPLRYGQTEVNWTHFLYYSFITLTSTGYGDISPVTQHAQSLVIIEAAMGTLYIAVLVARLVGLYNPRTTVEKPKHKDFKLDEFIKNL